MNNPEIVEIRTLEQAVALLDQWISHARRLEYQLEDTRTWLAHERKSADCYLRLATQLNSELISEQAKSAALEAGVPF